MLQERPSNSILVNTDSYKVSMPQQYPPGTKTVFSYIESRGGRYDQTLFALFQPFLHDVMLRRVTKDDVDYAEKFWAIHGEPFDRARWDYIVDKHYGKLPVRIKAVPEGTVVPTGNVLVTVENTDPKCYWLTTWLETAMLRAVWYPTTVATISWSIKKLIKSYLEKSGDVAGLPFKLHDFGARGVSSNESAALGSAAHLVNFMGTDSPQGIVLLNEYYNAPLETIGFSIPAAEHSTITSWTREGEPNAYGNMIDLFGKKDGLFATVSDSFDIFKACHIWGSLKDKIIQSGATLVIRPDSGDPVSILPKLFHIIETYFGSVKNAKGFKVMNHVRFLWGDGIDEQSIGSILRVLVDVYGWSADNIAFGMGGALLQHCDRDWLKFAMKCSAIEIENADGTTEWRDVYKDPVTDPGKTSKKGRLGLNKNADGTFYTGREDWPENQLELVYEDGELYRDMNLGSVRKNAEV